MLDGLMNHYADIVLASLYMNANPVLADMRILYKKHDNFKIEFAKKGKSVTCEYPMRVMYAMDVGTITSTPENIIRVEIILIHHELSFILS